MQILLAAEVYFIHRIKKEKTVLGGRGWGSRTLEHRAGTGKAGKELAEAEEQDTKWLTQSN